MATKKKKAPADGVMTRAKLKELLGKVGANLDHRPPPLERLSTGIAYLDYVIEGGFPRKRVTELWGFPGSGKAQPLSARICTPQGWRLMGDIHTGDQVINPEGGYATVIGVYPQGQKDIYRVTFNDGSSTECCDDHLWRVETRRYKSHPEVLSLREIRKHLTDGYKPAHSIRYIPMVTRIDFQKRQYEVDPYLVGVLLGDGNLTAGSVLITTADPQILQIIAPLLPEEVKLAQRSQYGYALTAGKKAKHTGERARNPLITALRHLGLMDCGAQEKFIPADYLVGSHEQRVALLQGLMDTDGTSGRSRLELSTISPILAQNVSDLVQSLGGVVKVGTKQPSYTYKGEKRLGQLCYRVAFSLPRNIAPFRLSRKLAAYCPGDKYPPYRYIASVDLVGQKKEARCIMLDSENQLYVTDNYIVTHNTTICMLLARTTMLGGGHIAWCDTEATFNEDWAAKLGVPVDLTDEQGNYLLDFPYPAEPATATMETWLTILLELVKSNLYDVIVVDTWAHMSPRGEQETPMDKTGQVGTFAKLTTRLYRMLSPWLPASKTAVVVVNQVRANFGDEYHPHGTTGGWALQHEASLILQTFHAKTEYYDEARTEPQEHEFRFYVDKTKVSHATRKLYSIFLVHDPVGDFWEVDQLAAIWELAVTGGVFQDADGNPWKKGKVCYFDALRWGYPADGLLTDPKRFNVRGAVRLETAEDAVKAAIRGDELMLAAVMRAVEGLLQADQEDGNADPQSDAGEHEADTPEDAPLFVETAAGLQVG